MKLALIGHGKMGKIIEQLALHKGHEIVLTSDSSRRANAADLRSSGADVAIEFTNPEVAVESIFACFEANVPVVIGTTGWYARLPEVKQRCSESNGALFYASNFSLGVNLFFHFNKMVAETMDRFPMYEPHLTEIHHVHKKDAPSGTAITLAEDLIDRSTKYSEWNNDFETGQGPLGVVSVREDDIPGTHKIVYRSEIDEITLEHRAFSREGFANGAIHAAEWLKGKQGAYTMRNLLKL
jgi:4-hydroxy-tetrahydrodipicolinate reductase